MSTKNIKIILGIVVLLLGVAGTVLGVLKAIENSERAALQQPAGEIFTGTKTTAYYFHRTGRCATCNNVGSTADETITKDFAQQLKDGKLEWKFVDYEAPENRHFEKLFDLAGPTLVIVNIKDGKLQNDWKKLDRMWELKNNDVLKQYFHDEVQSMLGGEETKVTATPEKQPSLGWGQPFSEQGSDGVDLFAPLTSSKPLGTSTTPASENEKTAAVETAPAPESSKTTDSPRSFLTLLLLVLWLGILTSISPCPLATNIAAVSFIGKQVASKQGVLWSGFMYTIGRAVVYVVLASIVIAGLFQSSVVSGFLEDYLNLFVGPLLLLAAPVMLGWIGGRLTFTIGGEKLHKRFAKAGGIGALMLGILFALSLCPISAGIFFGPLLLAAIEAKSSIFLPTVYGIATGLPVFGFAIIIAFASNYLGKAFHHLTAFEKWARLITGVVFILIGIYLTLTYSIVW